MRLIKKWIKNELKNEIFTLDFYKFSILSRRSVDNVLDHYVILHLHNELFEVLNALYK